MNLPILVLILCMSCPIMLVSCQLPALISCSSDKIAKVDIPSSLMYEKKQLSFSLNPGELSCGNDTFLYSVKIPNPSKFGKIETKSTAGEVVYFASDGSIRVGNEYYTNEDYCVKKISKFKFDIQLCKLNPSSTAMGNNNIAISIIYGVVMFISCGLYVVTIAVYIVIWKNQKFHMYIVMSYVISLLLLHLFFGTSNMVQLESMDDHLNGSLFCLIVGSATHLFILSTFSWLTMINMNLWTTFNTLNVPNPSLSEGQGIVKFFFFSLFSWGLPIAVVATGLALDNFNKNNEDPSSPFLLGPKYGQTRCMISTEAEGWWLFYPIGILLTCNLLFFGLTVIRLIFYQKITRNVIGEKSDKKWRIINVYLKLLAIATILWAFEMASWVFRQENFAWYWLLVDVLNLFQSAVIFMMFVCRKSIYEQLQKKYSIITTFSGLCYCGEEIF